MLYSIHPSQIVCCSLNDLLPTLYSPKEAPRLHIPNHFIYCKPGYELISPKKSTRIYPTPGSLFCYFILLSVGFGAQGFSNLNFAPLLLSTNHLTFLYPKIELKKKTTFYTCRVFHDEI